MISVLTMDSRKEEKGKSAEFVPYNVKSKFRSIQPRWRPTRLGI